MLFIILYNNKVLNPYMISSSKSNQSVSNNSEIKIVPN